MRKPGYFRGIINQVPMSNIIQAADKYLPRISKVESIQREYVTDDIIKAVLRQYERTKSQCKQFAPHLKGHSIYQTCFNIWKFWRQNIRYQMDNTAAKQQIVKSPGAVWQDKFADCKSFSIAVMSCLHCLGIEGVFRFVSFNYENPTIVTHVYVVAFDGDREIKIDCVLPNFDMEKPYVNKYDYLPSGITAVSGVAPVKQMRKRMPKKCRGKLDLSNISMNELTHEVLGLMIDEQRLELEQNIAAKVHGIGSVKDRAYEIELAAINNAIAEITGTRPYVRLVEKLPHEISSISGPKERKAKKAAKKEKKQEKKLAKAVKKNTAGKAVNKKQAKLLEKANIVVKKKKEGILKKIGKGIVKVVTAPFRLIAKGILEVTLPKASPFFLYLFIKDPKLIAKLPNAVRIKRDKAIQISNTIIKKIGMKEDHFMGIVRNGIMGAFSDTPENVLAIWMKNANFSIGLLGALSQALPFVKDLAGKVVGLKAQEMEQYMPSEDDWYSMTEEQRLQAAEKIVVDPANNDVLANRGTIPIMTEDQMYNSTATPGYNTPTNYDYSGGGTSLYNNSEPIPGSQGYNSNDFFQKDGEVEVKELENVTVGPEDDGKEKSNGGGILLLGLGLVALTQMK